MASATQETEATASVFRKVAEEHFVRYRATLKFDRWCMGGIPKDAKLIEGWIAKGAGVPDSLERKMMVIRTLQELGQEIPADADYDQIIEAARGVAGKQHTNGFKANGSGPYIESRAVKAMLREATNIVFPWQGAGDGGGSPWKGVTGKTPHRYFRECVFIEPYEIPFDRDEPDGIELFIGHPDTPRGTGATLTYYEYVERGTISFDVLDHAGKIKPQWWERIWVHAERLGLGALRSQGFGTFAVIAWERIPAIPENGSRRSRARAVPVPTS